MSFFEDIAKLVAEDEQRTSRRGVRPEDAANQPDNGTPGVGDQAIVTVGRGMDALNDAQARGARNVFEYFSPNPDLVNARASRSARESYGTTDPEGVPRKDVSTFDRLADVLDVRGPRSTEVVAAVDPAADEIAARLQQLGQIAGGKIPDDYDSTRRAARQGIEDMYAENPTAEKVGKGARTAGLALGSLGLGAGGLAGVGALSMGGQAALESEGNLEDSPIDVAIPGGIGAIAGGALGGALGSAGGKLGLPGLLKASGTLGAGIGGNALLEGESPVDAATKGAKAAVGTLGVGLLGRAGGLAAPLVAPLAAPLAGTAASELMAERRGLEGPELSAESKATLNAPKLESWESLDEQVDSQEFEDFGGWDSLDTGTESQTVDPSEFEEFSGWE